ncbi:hypothetical protein SAMD00019534_105250 [Acytostelium subglobosum LB1]|uniref:hypothetical protein n=1 Tax=Acytostelium subglobosum LB1 TaxID=1410327 RepID=UPI00064505DE|nr:hypothetical protein SAMD00019534_105250 [Acytostelium subglobosum LB1]GAM27350.1 hypothetical protein SAMD00019534_105250 [Acytostelium subglobosum LB1]|eukprot:XP_012749817.1 hypothetical protein SAMD00019534_105250 [Acytostelium subglobosum LB1]
MATRKKTLAAAVAAAAAASPSNTPIALSKRKKRATPSTPVLAKDESTSMDIDTDESVVIERSARGGKMMSTHSMSNDTRLRRLSSKKKSPNTGSSSSPSSASKKSPSKNNKKVTSSSTGTSLLSEFKAAKSWDSEKVRNWDIQEAPVFYPTVEEFRHPLAYIEKIRPIGEKYGICKVVPPYKAQPIMTQIDPKTFKFKTKLQNIHQLKTRWSGPSEVFVAELCSFLEERGESMLSFPQYDGHDLDLYRLFVEVNKRGGYWDVTRSNGWQEILVLLKVSDKCYKPIQMLKQHYNKYLYAYELARKAQYDELLKQHPNKQHPSMIEQVISECIQYDESNDDDADDMEDDQEDFGFYEGNTYSLEHFEQLASNFSMRWFPNGNNDPDSVESEFWRIVENGDENVQVHYGSDLDVRTHGSGFERVKDFDPNNEETHPKEHWNLNTLPKMKRSVFSHLTDPVSGVTDPMMYVGMLFSSFCWHNEDNYLYSINYMHTGTYKTWYGVAGDQSEVFERAMQESLPKLFSKTPNLLSMLITMMSPAALKESKVPVCRTLQSPGDFIITFPQAYHAGFSHGFTVAEAVNFAPADWLPYGVKSTEHYQAVHRTNVFCLEQLMMALSKRAPSPELIKWLLPCLEKIYANEKTARAALIAKGCVN